EEAQVDWSRPAYVVDRLVRGCTPNPGAWTTFRGERVKVEPLSPVTDEVAGPPGTLVVGKRDVHVATGDGSARLGVVQATGKRPMPAADWARGLRVEPGERLGHG